MKKYRIVTEYVLTRDAPFYVVQVQGLGLSWSKVDFFAHLEDAKTLMNRLIKKRDTPLEVICSE